MQFNGEANNLDLCTLSDDLLGGTDDTDFPLRQKALYGNWGLREIVKEILQIYGGWQYIDSNETDDDNIDQAKTNLLADGSQFYPFVNVSWIAGAAYEDENGNQFPLEPITIEEIQDRGYTENEFMDTAGKPQYYRPVQDGIKIYPSSDTAVTNGLIVQIGAKDITVFTPSSTTQEPGYDSLAGHEAVAIFMAMTKARIDTLDVFAGLRDSWLTALAGIKAHYKKKFKQVKPQIRKSTGGASYADNFIS